MFRVHGNIYVNRSTTRGSLPCCGTFLPCHTVVSEQYISAYKHARRLYLSFSSDEYIYMPRVGAQGWSVVPMCYLFRRMMLNLKKAALLPAPLAYRLLVSSTLVEHFFSGDILVPWSIALAVAKRESLDSGGYCCSSCKNDGMYVLVRKGAT